MSYPNPNWPPPQQSPFGSYNPQQPAGGGFYPPPPKPEGGLGWLWIALGVVGGGGLLVVLVCCGGVMYLAQPPKASAAAKEPFPYGDLPFLAFPDDRGEPQEIEPGVLQYTIALGPESGGYYSKPGQGGFLYLYLPPGEHAARSLPCVLITGAGSTLLAGMEIGEGDWPEHIPYVKAGYAVLAYELDGPDYSDGDTKAMVVAHEAFERSRAGLVNAYNAMEYAITKVPEIDPARIYAAGHSSAGTHALLFAEHEPRLAGVMAYAPAVDLPKWFEGRLRILSFILPDLADFVTQSSPSTHAERLKCPTFLFVSEQDTTSEVADVRKFANRLTAQGTDVKLVTVPTGDHYSSMIDEGIPAGIEWLRERGTK